MVAIGEVVKILDKIPNPPNVEDFSFPIDESLLSLFGFAQSGVPFFSNPLSGPISQCIAQINDAVQVLDGLPFLSQSEKNRIGNVLLDTAGTLGDWNGHINQRLVGGLNKDPGFLGQISNEIRIRATTAALQDTNNACQDMQDFLGSVLGTGQENFNQLGGPLNQVLDAINEEGDVNSVFNSNSGAILAATAVISALIARETANLANMSANALAWGLASTVGALVGDPCAQAVFNAAGTSALLDSLPNLPKFP